MLPYQENFDGTQNVHGSCKCGSQIKTEAYSTPKLWAQGPRDHVVRASSYK